MEMVDWKISSGSSCRSPKAGFSPHVIGIRQMELPFAAGME